jgi:glycosyltransferase involved in cell wall biosynthesis
MLQTSTAPPNLHGKSLLIFDDGLVSRDGHWFEIDKAIARFHADNGARTVVVAHAEFCDYEEFAAIGVRVLPLIKQSLWTGWVPREGLVSRLAKSIPLPGPLHEWAGNLSQARHFRRVLSKVLNEEEFDCVLHPTALMADFLAWSLMPRAVRRRAKRVVLSTWYPIATYHEDRRPSFARKLALWKLIGWKLRKRFATGRMLFVTDSRRIADEYETASGMEAIVVGSPREIAVSVANPQATRTSVTFGSLGAARWEKGIDVLEAAIGKLVASDRADRLRFVIQWNRPVERPDGTIHARDLRVADSPRVNLLDNVLSSKAYDQALADIDCMVLPYRRLMYQSRSSAVAVEAACAGIPMIYTADTWLSDFVDEQGAGIAVADGDVEGLERAILTVATNYSHYRTLALERSAIARSRNSPEQFARTLWGARQNLGAGQ